jgi:hypothetical protein
MLDWIYDVLAAVKHRRPSLTATDGIEERGIENAQEGLLTLRTERAGDQNAMRRTRVSRAGRVRRDGLIKSDK